MIDSDIYNKCLFNLLMEYFEIMEVVKCCKDLLM